MSDLLNEINQGKSKALIKRQVRRAFAKSIAFTFLFLASIFFYFGIMPPINGSVILAFIFCFLFVHNAVFIFWFGRKVAKYIDWGTDLDASQSMRDSINTVNGYPPGMEFFTTKSSFRD